MTMLPDAAAPELLAACKALLKVASAMGIEAKLDLWPWSEEDGTVCIGAGEAMAKAIAKAEGKA